MNAAMQRMSAASNYKETAIRDIFKLAYTKRNSYFPE